MAGLMPAGAPRAEINYLSRRAASKSANAPRTAAIAAGSGTVYITLNILSSGLKYKSAFHPLSAETSIPRTRPSESVSNPKSPSITATS